jgi:glycosyltransferase involved in cell wall biosynthesis
MKIAVFHNLPYGGAKRALYNVTKQLTKAGHVVDAFVPASADESFMSLRDVVRDHRVFQRQRTFRGRASTALRFMAGLPHSWVNYEVTQESIAEAINAGAYDVALVEQDYWTMSPFVLKYLKGPAVYYCDQPDRSEEAILLEGLKLEDPSTGWRARRDKYLRAEITEIDKQNARFASYMVTNSYCTREAILRAYGVNAFVCYLGTDVDFFHPMGLPRENFVLSVGGCHHIKGFDFIIRTLGRMDAKGRPKFVIVSNAWETNWEEYLAQFAASFEVELTIRKVIPDSELVRLYNQAKAFVYAPYLEPFGLAVLEAMACGTPVIAVREAGVRESVIHDETGILVERDEEAFAQAIIELLDDDPKRKRLACGALEVVRGFWTWELAAQRLEVHLSRCANQRTA